MITLTQLQWVKSHDNYLSHTVDTDGLVIVTMREFYSETDFNLTTFDRFDSLKKWLGY